MIKTATKPKARKSLIVSAIAAVSILGSLMALPASASVTADNDYTDNVPVSTENSVQMPTHTYFGNTIAANPIRVESTSRVDYYLQCYVQGLFDNFWKKGANVNCDTEILGGYYYWEDSIDGRGVAYLNIKRKDKSTSPLSGTIRSFGTEV